MKKYITLIILLITLLTTNSVLAKEVYEFVWDNTYVDVELYDDLSKYTSIPKAKFKRNGVVMNDALISYNIDGAWLYYLKDVDTTKIGEYKVWYRAYESRYNPGTCNNYKALVTFNVRDTKSTLEINVTGKYDESLKAKVVGLDINSTKKDLLNNNIITVNYKYDYKLIIDDSNVKYGIPGIYEVIVYAYDQYNKEYNLTFYIDIKDNTKIMVTNLKDVIIKERNMDINWEEYINVKGHLLKDCHIVPERIDESLIDKVQTVNFILTTTTGNKTTFSYDVIIKDSIKPIIKLTVESIVLDFGVKYIEDDFKEFILEAYDGDIDLRKNVLINTSHLDVYVGDYAVIFSVYDDDNNYTEETLIVSIRSKIPPTIDVKDVTIRVNESVDFDAYITVIDESDPNIKNKIEKDLMDFDNTKVGTYYIKIFVTNDSGQTNHAIMKVRVIEDTKDLNLVKLVSIAGVIVIGILYVIYYKKKKNKDEEISIDI